MTRIRLVIGDPESGKTTQLELSEQISRTLHGKIIGETVEGSSLGLGGYQFKITGGSDGDGAPMRPDVHGAVRKRPLLSGGIGYQPKNKGERRRRRVRGNEITDVIVQVNVKIVIHGETSLLELIEKSSS
ncbi:MAG: 30S ribosomal protein S6e [Candidatus Hermodarchaeia archaeon]|jgi:small subunit ribosomal protein S6e